MKELHALVAREVGTKTPPKADGMKRVLEGFRMPIEARNPLKTGQRDGPVSKQFDHVSVDYLADHDAAFPRVVEWLHEQWFREWGYSRRKTADELRGRLNRAQPPLTFVALVGGQPVGTASLLEDEKPTTPGRVCCLAGVYVLPEWRRRGIGRLLCQRAVLEAERLQLSCLGLFTRDCEQFYARMGWKKVTDAVLPNGAGLDLFAFMFMDEKYLTPRPRPLGKAPAVDEVQAALNKLMREIKEGLTASPARNYELLRPVADVQAQLKAGNVELARRTFGRAVATLKAPPVAPEATPAPKTTRTAVARKAALGNWRQARALVIGQLRKLGAAIKATNDPEAARAAVLLKAIQAHLTAQPGTRESVRKLEWYLQTADIIAEAESPNGFGLNVAIRKSLLDALSALKPQLRA